MSDAPIRVGDHVVDTDADDPNPAVVVSRSGLNASEHVIDDATGKTVADVNPDYAATDGVVSVVYPDTTAGDLSGRRYAYPVGRLDVTDALHDEVSDGE